MGLLGNFNSNIDDDFMTPDGSILSSTADQKTIHYDFGELCKYARCMFDIISFNSYSCSCTDNYSNNCNYMIGYL